MAPRRATFLRAVPRRSVDSQEVWFFQWIAAGSGPGQARPRLCAAPRWSGTQGMLRNTPHSASWMIVTCPQCQTRFRIPDDKVTPKGVKVRCTRCRHTFRVSRPLEPDAAAAADPFAQFGPPDALSELDKTPARGTPAAALGVQVEPGGPPASDDFDVDVEAPEARRAVMPPRDPEWSYAPPPRPPEPPVLAPAPPDLRDAHARTPTTPLARTPAPQRAGHEALPEEMAPPPEEPPDGGRLELDTGSPESSWQGSLEGGLDLPPPSAASELDFGDLNLDGPIVPPPAAPPSDRALDFDSLESRPPITPAAAAAAADEPGEPFPPPPPPVPHTPVPVKTPTGELFGRSATPLDEEPFPGGPGRGEENAGERAALFEMPEPARAEEPAAPTSLLADVPDAAPEAPPPTPSVSLPPVAATPIGRISRPPTGTAVLGLEERRELGRARRVSGTVVNIGVAALLVLVLAAVGNVYVNEGRLDWAALSPARWASLFVPPSGIVTRDVSNGLYETRGGRPLAYVRGRVENRGDRPGQVRVRAEIWDGSQLLGASEGLAGAVPTPEDLVEAGTRQDVEALRVRLEQSAPAVAPGKGTDFVLLFDEPPTELTGLRLKVSAAAVGGR